MKETGPAPEFFTVKEVATKLRVNRMTVYRLIRSGKLRGQRISERNLRIPADAYAEYLEATEVQA